MKGDERGKKQVQRQIIAVNCQRLLEKEKTVSGGKKKQVVEEGKGKKETHAPVECEISVKKKRSHTVF